MADIALIKQLREETDLPFDVINKALTDANGDIACARELLEENTSAMASKKSERLAKEGYIASYVHSTGKVASLVALSCETDFVARNEEFRALARDIAMQVVALRPTDVVELVAQQFIKDDTHTVGEIINQAIGKLGENIQVASFSIQIIGS